MEVYFLVLAKRNIQQSDDDSSFEFENPKSIQTK